MSQWTHVCGAIRIDGIPNLDGLNTLKIKDAFGNTCEYDDDSSVWDNCDVPCGSEGSLQYKIEHTGDNNSLSWGIVYIWGDLRSYDDYNAIYIWIKKACEHLMIRSCSIKIDVEYHGKYLVTDFYDSVKSSIVLFELKELKSVCNS